LRHGADIGQAAANVGGSAGAATVQWRVCQSSGAALRGQVASGGGANRAEQIQLAYRLALAREPNENELRAMLRFLDESSPEELARVILNLNEFAYTN
jgi:hypothetical protein